MLDIEEVVPMLRRPRIVPTTIVTLLAVFGSRAAAQTVQRSIVVLPPVEIGANVSFTERFDTPPGQHDWTGPGLSLVANANLTRHVALAVEANTFDGQTTLLAGARLGTDFYYGSSRDPVPGRFVGRVLIGSVASGTATSNFGVQIGVGADVLFKQPRGTGVHWEVGYRIVPSARMRQAAGYAEIGVIVGPRLR
jgi:hypothetical protein